MDTDDILKKFRKSKLSPLLNGGDETSLVPLTTGTAGG